MVYENNTNEGDQNSLERFHIELLFSPGLYPCFLTEKEQIYEKRFNSHKKTPQPLNRKKSKNSNTKPSGDHSEKEDNEAPITITSSSSNKSNEMTTAATPCEQVTSTTYDGSLLSGKQSSPGVSNNSSTKSPSSKKEKEGEAHESDDELTDHAVNLVVLGEVAGKKFSVFLTYKAHDQLFR